MSDYYCPVCGKRLVGMGHGNLHDDYLLRLRDRVCEELKVPYHRAVKAIVLWQTQGGKLPEDPVIPPAILGLGFGALRKQIEETAPAGSNYLRALRNEAARESEMGPKDRITEILEDAIRAAPLRYDQATIDRLRDTLSRELRLSAQRRWPDLLDEGPE